MVAEIGKVNVDRTAIMKEMNVQSVKMMYTVTERHAVRTGMDCPRYFIHTGSV
jgi:hypothetical protein